MNRVIKRMQRGVAQTRPTLTRGNKSYSDSTMETVTSDQNSIPSNSTRDTLQNNNSSHHRSNHTGSEEISEDETTHHDASSQPNPSQQRRPSSGSKNVGRDDASFSTHQREKKNRPMHTVTPKNPMNHHINTKRTSAVSFAMDYDSPPEVMESNVVLSEDELMDCFYTVRLFPRFLFCWYTFPLDGSLVMNISSY